MKMCLHLWGTDFHRGSQELRSHLYIVASERKKILGELISLGFRDLIYLHTCNRVEFYTTARDHFYDTRALWQSLFEKLGLGAESYHQGYHLEGKAAVRHLFRVASSLESMVVGEPQILGQVKTAFDWVKNEGFPIEPFMKRCFSVACAVAKSARTDTSLGKNAVSLTSLGLQELQRRECEGPIESVVIIGRGEMSLLFLRWILKNRPGVTVIWVNRTLEKLKAMDECSLTRTMALKDFLESPPPFTHLFSATACRQAILDRLFLEKYGSGRVFFDFAEPADIERFELPGVTIVGLEHLNEISQRNSELRKQSVEEVERLIESALKSFYLDLKQAPVLRDFSTLEPRVLAELESAFASFAKDVPSELVLRFKQWAEKLVRKNLHHSREHLRSVLQRVVEPESTPPL